MTEKREKNRKAVRKYREKIKSSISESEIQIKKLQIENTHLKETVQKLENQLSVYKGFVSGLGCCSCQKGGNK